MHNCCVNELKPKVSCYGGSEAAHPFRAALRYCKGLEAWPFCLTGRVRLIIGLRDLAGEKKTEGERCYRSLDDEVDLLE